MISEFALSRPVDLKTPPWRLVADGVASYCGGTELVAAMQLTGNLTRKLRVQERRAELEI